MIESDKTNEIMLELERTIIEDHAGRGGKYRCLAHLEEIKASDEVYDNGLHEWEPVHRSMVGAHWTEHLRVIRRAVSA